MILRINEFSTNNVIASGFTNDNGQDGADKPEAQLPNSRQRVSSKFRVYSFGKNAKTTEPSSPTTPKHTQSFIPSTSQTPTTPSATSFLNRHRKTHSLNAYFGSSAHPLANIGEVRTQSPDSSTRSQSPKPKGIGAKYRLPNHYLPHFSLRRSGSGTGSGLGLGTGNEDVVTASSSTVPLRGSKLSEAITLDNQNDNWLDELNRKRDGNEESKDNKSSGASDISQAPSNTGSVIIHR